MSIGNSRPGWGRGAIALLALVATSAQATIYSVGTDAGCTHATVQDAINTAVAATSSTAHVIKLATGTVAVPNGLTLFNAVADINIVGGYSSCTGTPTAGARTTLDASGGADGTVLDIRYFGTPTSRSIHLSGLVITGGTGETGPFASSEGAGLELRGNLLVYLDQGSQVQGNSAVRGAGVLLQGGPGIVELLLRDDASIHDNFATTDGGGVWCYNLGITEIGDASIDFNQAGRDGGGIYLGTKCALIVGSPFSPLSDYNSISNNTAGTSTSYGRGGGVYYESTAGESTPYDLDVEGVPGAPVYFINNHASRGGAMYLLGQAAARVPMLIHNVAFINNTDASASAGVGGSIVAYGALDLTLSGSASRTCSGGLFGLGLCSVMTGAAPQGIDATQPGAQSIWPRLTIRRTLFSGNMGPVILYSFGPDTDSLLDMDSVIIADNSSDRGLVNVNNAFGTRTWRMRYSTVTGNTADRLIIPNALSGATVQADFTGSLIWNPGSTLLAPGGAGTVSVDHGGCLLAHSTAGINNPAQIRTSDPHLGADFTPAANSPALDVCNQVFALPGRDVYGTPRPVDQPGVVNALGAYDLGAVERAAPDVLFANGFESGAGGP